MKLAVLFPTYIFAMVQLSYKYEAGLHHMKRMLTDEELLDFYSAYMGGAPCIPT